MDALASEVEEGRGRLRKAPGSCQRALIRRYPNGATWPVEDRSSCTESIGIRREAREVKHLSTSTKGNQSRLPQ